MQCGRLSGRRFFFWTGIHRTTLSIKLAFVSSAVDHVLVHQDGLQLLPVWLQHWPTQRPCVVLLVKVVQGAKGAPGGAIIVIGLSSKEALGRKVQTNVGKLGGWQVFFI